MADEAAVLRVSIDHGGQKRLNKEEVRIFLNGLDWDQQLSSNVWFDSTTGAVMRKPAFMDDAAWASSNSGINSKLTKGGGATYGYTLTTAGSWDNASKHSLGQLWYLDSKNINESVISTFTWEANQPFVISWFTHGATDSGQDEEGTRLDFGWGTPGGSSPTSFTGYPSDRVRAYRFDEPIKDSDFTTPARIGERKTKRGNAGQDQQGKFVSWWVEPLDYGVLVTSMASGGSFHVRFDDADDDTYTLPEAQFWWWLRKGTGATDNPMATVLAAPVQYLPTPYVISDIIHLEILPHPDSTPVQYSIYAPSGGTDLTYELLNAAGTAPWNETDTELRIKVYLDTTIGFSGSLYSFELSWPPIIVRTDGSEEVDLNELSAEEAEENGSFELRSLSFSVPEGLAGATARLTCLNPTVLDEKLETTNVRTICNRPMRLHWGRVSGAGTLIDGRGGEPETVYHWNPEAESISWEIFSQDAQMARCFLRARLNLGGLLLHEAFTRLAKVTGCFEDEDLDIEVSTFRLPNTNAAMDDAENVCKPGDNPWEWMGRLMETYSALDSLKIVPTAERVWLRYRTFYVEA